eukprot:5754023-Pyramimonas_sp.AAC.1
MGKKKSSGGAAPAPETTEPPEMGWSTCQQCGRQEWNRILWKQQCRCPKCHTVVTLHRPKASRGAQMSNTSHSN